MVAVSSSEFEASFSEGYGSFHSPSPPPSRLAPRKSKKGSTQVDLRKAISDKVAERYGSGFATLRRIIRTRSSGDGPEGVYATGKRKERRRKALSEMATTPATAVESAQTKSKLVCHLDTKINEDKGDRDYCKQFESILLKLMEEDELLSETGVKDIKSVSKLLEILLDYRNTRRTEGVVNKKMISTYNLMRFYDEIDRRELYAKYLYELAALQESVKNYTEAGFTLKMAADHLSWSTTELPGDGKFKAQKEWERKRILFEQILDLFDKGQTWEFGISICKELATFYECNLVDYQRLGAILQRQAEFCKNILEAHRIKQIYYHIGFYGNFATFLKNNAFIYKGAAFEQISTVTKNLREDFPSAQIIPPSTVVTEDMKNSSGQYIQPFKVNPVPSEPAYFGKALNPISDKVKDFYQTNMVTHFQYDTPFHRGEKDPACEFKTLWLLRQTLCTSSPMPGPLSWVRIESSEKEELSPLLAAVDVMKKKNAELTNIINTTKKNYNNSLSSLTMALQGTIDAAVGGGFEVYKAAFLSQSYQQENPDDEKYVQDLFAMYDEQLSLLSSGLKFHMCVVSNDLRPLHEELDKKFKKMRQTFAHQAPDRHTITSSTIDRRNDSRASSGYGSSVNDFKSNPPTKDESGGFPEDDGSTADGFDRKSKNYETPRRSSTVHCSSVGIPPKLMAHTDPSRRNPLVSCISEPAHNNGSTPTPPPRPPVPTEDVDKPPPLPLRQSALPNYDTETGSGSPALPAKKYSFEGGIKPPIREEDGSINNNNMEDDEEQQIYDVVQPPAYVPKLPPRKPSIGGLEGRNSASPTIPARRSKVSAASTLPPISSLPPRDPVKPPPVSSRPRSPMPRSPKPAPS